MALQVIIPVYGRSRALRLLKGQWRRSGIARVGPPSLNARYSVYRDYQRSGVRGLTRSRHDWNRIYVPVYGSLARTIPVAPVIVPDWLRFQVDGLVPAEAPMIQVAPGKGRARYRSLGASVPELEFQLAHPPGRDALSAPRHESVRRRRDSKHGGDLYHRILAAGRKVIDRPSEYLEFLTTVYYNWRNPAQLVTALAMNEAVDYSVGTSQRFLKDNVYGTYWNFPVGFTALSRLWR